MRATVCLLTALLLLVGCVPGNSDLDAIGPELVKTYSAGFLDRAADELEALPDGSALAVMIADYAVLREQLRSAD